ncbi:NifU family protein [uncultured Dubosiella sp.]|nr:NifU family protein [uncultured Dubosiella sp.]
MAEENKETEMEKNDTAPVEEQPQNEPATKAQEDPQNIVVEEEQVEECLDKIRPYIQHDGGDVELLGIDEQNIAYVSFRGACAGCMMAADDFSGGIKLLLLDEIPGLRDVVLV